jgi:transcriptional antiterminator RfaH
MADWYVVRTHAHAENKARENLVRQGFEVCLPTCRRWRKHARRREIVLRPLFPNYLFVSFNIESDRWRSIFSTYGVAGLICNGEMPTRVPQGTVESIKEAEAAGFFDYTNAVSELKPGDPVRVASGPFAGLIGKLQATASRDRVRVLLEILGRQTATVVVLSELEAL